MADHVDSPVKELVPIVIGTPIWGRLWHRGHVCFHTDNMAVVAILCKKSAQDPLAHQFTMFFLFLWCIVVIPLRCRACTRGFECSGGGVRRGGVSANHQPVVMAMVRPNMA